MQTVKTALENLRDKSALRASRLASLRGDHSDEHELAHSQALLLEVVSELAMSPKPRDSEAGRLLLDYYVKRVGSHEVVMERLYLSRPTFYRRLKYGLILVAHRLDDLAA